MPEPQQVPGDPGLGVGQERQDVDLGVPEVVALVGLPGQPLRRNTGPFGAPRPLRDLVEVPPDRLLLPHRIEPGLHLDVGAVPEPGQMRALALQERAEPVADRAVQRPAAPIDKLGHGDAAGGLVGRVLGDPDRHARHRIGREEHLARLVVAEGPRHLERARRLDHVINTDTQCHPAVGRLVAQKDALLSQLGRPHVEHPVRQHGRQPGISRPVLGQVAGQVGVLAVEHQRGDHHRRRLIQHRDLIRHRDQVAVLERDDPAGADPDVLAGASGPHQLTGQRPGPHVQDPPVVPQARRRQEERLVVHVQLEDRRVGHVHDRLAGPGQRMRPFGVRDRPGLMEPVDERPGNQRRAPLLEAAADADESVAKRKDGLGQTDELIGVPRLHNAPFVGWVEVLWRQLDFSLEHDPTVNPRTRYRQMAPTAITAIIRPAGPSPPPQEHQTAPPGPGNHPQDQPLPGRQRHASCLPGMQPRARTRQTTGRRGVSLVLPQEPFRPGLATSLTGARARGEEAIAPGAASGAPGRIRLCQRYCPLGLRFRAVTFVCWPGSNVRSLRVPGCAAPGRASWIAPTHSP